MHGSEAHFRSTLGVSGAVRLLDALQTSTMKARQMAVAANFGEPRTEPSVAFDLAVGLLHEFEDRPDVRKEVVNNQHLWILQDTYSIRVKKLNPGYVTRNHRSGQQNRISHQLRLDGLPPLIHVTAGTLFNKLTGLPQEYVVVKHVPGPMAKQQVEWVVDLEDLAAGGLAPATPILPLPGDPAAPAHVAARRRQPESGKNESKQSS